MLSDGQPPATHCACCGQEIRSAARLTLMVDDAVLALCNRAFATAEQRGHGEVGLAHLIVALLVAADTRALAEASGLTASGVAEAAELRLSQLPARWSGSAPSASADFRALLMRAEDHARRSGRTYASVSDLLSVMAALASGAGLVGAGSSRGATSVSTQRTADTDRATAGVNTAGFGALAAAHVSEAAAVARTDHAPALSALVTTTRPIGPAPASLATAQPLKSLAVVGDGADMAALLRRLEAQEADLAQLRAALQDRAASAGSGTRGGDQSGRLEPERRSRGGTYRLGVQALSTQSTSERVYLRRCLRQRQAQSRRRRARYGDATVAAAGSAGVDAARVRFGSMPRSWTRARRGASGGELGEDRSERDASARGRDEPVGETGTREKQFYLALDDDVERAPSIGAKTAARLNAAGIRTVRDLLDADPQDLAGRVRARFITAQRLTDWQAQARLVCSVPWLRGTHAQLLVGAGYGTAEAIAAAEPSAVCAAILTFAATRDGQSVLRSGPPPEMDRVLRWVENAAFAEPERAAA